MIFLQNLNVFVIVHMSLEKEDKKSLSNRFSDWFVSYTWNKISSVLSPLTCQLMTQLKLPSESLCKSVFHSITTALPQHYGFTFNFCFAWHIIIIQLLFLKNIIIYIILLIGQSHINLVFFIVLLLFFFLFLVILIREK